MVARPDARMVEVPLEIEAELPRDFEGAALLSSSGLPRKVKIKAQRDALKLSTAYRADQLLADVVRTVLRGSPIDIERVQIAAKNFVRSVRERRQDGATLTVESNGRGRIQVKEAMPPPREARAATPAVSRAAEGTVSDRITALERRLDQLEARVCECYAVVKREYDRLIPTALRHGIPNDQSRGLNSTSTRRSRRSSGSPNVPV